jgi:23S rRNA (guanine1835-N2)-methyltransferase
MANFAPLLDTVADRVRAPLAVVLGGTQLVADLLGGIRDRLADGPVVCYQMDVFQAERLREDLAEAGVVAEVRTAPDLWDLGSDFQTVLYPAAAKGERELKIDMVEQAYHLLRPRGTIVVLSPHTSDVLFPKLLKKVFGKVGMFGVPDDGTTFVCHADEPQPRRRHELSFHAKLGPEGESLTFVSRPGVFSYGRFDEGSRALAETMEVRPGERVLDIGSGVGTLGIFAARQGGPGTRVTFLDSNARAVALSELNARANGLSDFDCVLASGPGAVEAGTYDTVLANPPYFAGGSITRRFVQAAHAALKPGGRLLVVTKQPKEVEPILGESFEECANWQRRGYEVFEALRDTRVRRGPVRG